MAYKNGEIVTTVQPTIVKNADMAMLEETSGIREILVDTSIPILPLATISFGEDMTER